MLRESHRLGLEPATCKSQVQRSTAQPPHNTVLVSALTVLHCFDTVDNKDIKPLLPKRCVPEQMETEERGQVTDVDVDNGR